MNINRSYDVTIIGGGLAGLSLSILLARKNHRVCLFEKEAYPFHKVCGEYISMESWNFLTSLGLPLDDLNLPKINHLLLSSPNGKTIRERLPLGGFGISRFKLDASLAKIAADAGVEVFENTKVHDVTYADGVHMIQTNEGLFMATVTAACYGKKSNLDVKWKRKFTRNYRKQNYLGVKYHVQANLPEGQIALHNFKGGYCGISKIEDEKYCLCYLTTADNLKKNKQSIPAMEANVLRKNPVLRKLLDQIVHLYPEPVTIAQISFTRKTQIENHTLCIGDSAGMITPLCGNGMSMALHASKLAASSIGGFLDKKLTRDEMENTYQKAWNLQFSGRLKTGRIIQSLFGKPFISTWLIRVMKPFPFLIRALIRQTHGNNF